MPVKKEGLLLIALARGGHGRVITLFHERDGLVDIIRIAGLPMFREIPYTRMP